MNTPSPKAGKTKNLDEQKKADQQENLIEEKNPDEKKAPDEHAAAARHTTPGLRDSAHGSCFIAPGSDISHRQKEK